MWEWTTSSPRWPVCAPLVAATSAHCSTVQCTIRCWGQLQLDSHKGTANSLHNTGYTPVHAHSGGNTNIWLLKDSPDWVANAHQIDGVRMGARGKLRKTKPSSRRASSPMPPSDPNSVFRGKKVH